MQEAIAEMGVGKLRFKKEVVRVLSEVARGEVDKNEKGGTEWPYCTTTCGYCCSMAG
ncbi:hypothetical protein PLCT1_02168 [Planctomycetaceae bacterium]|nr:hypothetical protein PLCT1_02168 [Planctomycetaceae bacterium]